jgi:hypothetical protein
LRLAGDSRSSGNCFFQRSDCRGDPAQIGVAQSDVYHPDAQLGISHAIGFVSLPDGTQGAQRVLQARLPLGRSCPLARMIRRASVGRPQRGAHCGEILRRSLSLIGQQTLQSMQ